MALHQGGVEEALRSGLTVEDVEVCLHGSVFVYVEVSGPRLNENVHM